MPHTNYRHSGLFSPRYLIFSASFLVVGIIFGETWGQTGYSPIFLANTGVRSVCPHISPHISPKHATAAQLQALESELPNVDIEVVSGVENLHMFVTNYFK